MTGHVPTLPSPAGDAVQRLHAEFCRITGRSERIVFHQRAWSELLQSYGWDESRLAADSALVARYLKRQIAKGVRMPGALKLFNFLQPDKFDSDLSEARSVMPTPRAARVAGPEAEQQEPESEEARHEGTAMLRDCINKLKRRE